MTMGISFPSPLYVYGDIIGLVEKATSFNADFTQLPSTLTFSSEHDTVDGCLSACHRAGGDFLVGCLDGVKMLERETGQLTICDLPYESVYRVIEHHHVAYVLHKEGGIGMVDMCPLDSKKTLTLFEFENTSDYVPYLAVSDGHVVVNLPEIHELIIYDRMSHTQTKCKFQTLGVHFLSDGQLLTAGYDQLVKYNIADGQLTEIWKCRGLEDIMTVSADSNEVIFASTYRQCVYIISPAGELLREMKHDKLPEYPEQISVRDGELAVPDWNKKLYIFKVGY